MGRPDRVRSAIFLGVILVVTTTYLMSRDPRKPAEQRALKMRELAVEWSLYTQQLEGVGRLKPAEREEIYRQQFHLELEALKLFEDGPCPAALAELLWMEHKETVGNEWLWVFRARIGQVLPDIYLKSYLSILEGEDEAINERLKDLLPKLREEFAEIGIRPRGGNLDWFVDKYAKQNKLVPGWFVDGVYSCEVREDSKHLTEALEFFARHYDRENTNWRERRWACHVIGVYLWRKEYAPEKLTRQDLELTRKQTKWLWDTKKWWARRYVVEVLNLAPELGFPDVLEELDKENHPYVALRIIGLKLVEKLKGRLKGEN